MSEDLVKAKKNSSLRIPGPLTMLDEEGKQVELGEDTIFLCRCGGSQKKPFCDGTHKRNGFEGPEFTLERR